jgi:hypothetical protein
MDFIITDKGMEEIEKTGLKQLVDLHFDKLRKQLSGYWHWGDIKRHMKTSRVHPALRQAQAERRTITDGDYFTIFSYMATMD